MGQQQGRALQGSSSLACNGTDARQRVATFGAAINQAKRYRCCRMVDRCCRQLAR